MQTNRYVVATAPVHVPGALRSYAGQRVAVLEMDPAFRGRPAAIREGAPGVRRIVRDFGICADTAQADALARQLSGGVTH